MNRTKKILSVALASLMAASSATAFAASAAEADPGWMTDSHEIMEYYTEKENYYAVRGYFEGQWRMTTCGDYEFQPYIIGSDAVKVINCEPKFISSGKAIDLVYKIQNTGDSSSKVKFNIWADTMVAENDASTNIVSPDRSHITMVTNAQDVYPAATTKDVIFLARSTKGSGVQFKGAYFGETYRSYKNTDPRDYEENLDNNDSAMFAYWPEVTLEKGATKEYHLILAVTDKDSLDNLISDKHEHEWKSGKVVKAPTYGHTGTKSVTCKECKKTSTVSIPKLKITNKVKYNAKTSLSAGLKVTPSAKGIGVNWGKVAGVDGYQVYANYCGQDYKLVGTVKGSSKTSFNLTKIAGQALNSARDVKVYVKAYADSGKKKVQIARSVSAHIAGFNNTRFTNPKKVTVKNSKVTLAVGKTATVKATTTFQKAGKAHIGTNHVAALRFRSSNKAVATVDKNGKITAKGAGTCTVYTYAQNGYAAKTKVTVKEGASPLFKEGNMIVVKMNQKLGKFDMEFDFNYKKGEYTATKFVQNGIDVTQDVLASEPDLAKAKKVGDKFIFTFKGLETYDLTVDTKAKTWSWDIKKDEVSIDSVMVNGKNIIKGYKEVPGKEMSIRIPL